MESKGKIVKNKVDDLNNTFKRKKKDFKISSLLNVIKYSFQGYVHFYKYERSAILHLIVAIVIILGSLTLNMTAVEWLFMIFILPSIISRATQFY